MPSGRETTAAIHQKRCSPMKPAENTMRIQNASAPAEDATSDRPMTHQGSLRPATRNSSADPLARRANHPPIPITTAT